MAGTSPRTSPAHATSNSPATTCCDSPGATSSTSCSRRSRNSSPPLPSDVAQPTRILTTIVITHPAETDRAHDRARAHGGRVRRSAADGLLVTFDAPGQAIRSRDRHPSTPPPAMATSRATGIHTGEVDLAGTTITGTSLAITRASPASPAPARSSSRARSRTWSSAPGLVRRAGLSSARGRRRTVGAVRRERGVNLIRYRYAAASPSSRSTSTQSFHSPSSRPWRRWMPTSSNPAARCAARLGWLSAKIRLVSL